VVALIDRSGEGLDPYAFVEQKTQELLQKLAAFDSSSSSPFQRICYLASIEGFDVRPMSDQARTQEERDAMLVATKSAARRGLIVYNPRRQETRTVHSIAHEIIHSFFPNSDVGAQFRSGHKAGTGPAPELELLCDYGAAELTMPRVEFAQAVEEIGFGLEYIDAVRQRFGTSFEASAYRLATTSPLPVAVGLFHYRLAKGQLAKPQQGALFPEKQRSIEVTPKYRRQSFHHSRTYPTSLLLPWNKSLPIHSAPYRAAESGRLETGNETIAGRGTATGLFSIQSIRAPYQPKFAVPEWPSMIVLLSLLQ